MARILALFLIVGIGACAAAMEPDALSPSQYREDIEAFRDFVKQRHADPFRNLDEADFDAALDALSARADEIDFMEFAVGLQAIGASLKEGHTGVMLHYDRDLALPVLPIELWPVEDGWAVIATTPDHAGLIGSRIVSIGGVPMARVAEAVEPLYSRDSPAAVRKGIGHIARVPAILEGIGLLETAKQAQSVVLDVGGERKTVNFETIDRFARGEDRTEMTFVRPGLDTPFWIANREIRWRAQTIGGDGRTLLYLQFNSADTGADPAWDAQAFQAFTKEVTSMIETDPAIETLIVDLRWNDGGSITNTRRLPVDLLATGRFDAFGDVFVLTSPVTFSAAVFHLERFMEFFGAIVVGEASAGKPQHSAELGRMNLPHSGLEARVSVRSSYHSDEHRLEYTPDLVVAMTAGDLRAGRDPVLDAALNFDSSLSLADELEAALEEGGAQGVIARYRDLKANERHRYIFDQGVLNALGYDLLLNRDRPEDALALFRLNAEDYPWSPNVYDSLADAYRALGQNREAIENYRRAMSIDPRFSYSIPIVKQLKAKMEAE